MEKGKGKIRGARMSPFSSTLEVSCGIPSIDVIIGGGIPIGSVVLVEQDVLGAYTEIISRCFLSEGIVNEHPIFIASLESSPQQIIGKLPAPVEEKVVSNEKHSASNEMKIAWRYHDLPMHEISSSIKFGHHYDLSRTLSKETIDIANIKYFEKSGKSNAYKDLLDSIERRLKCNKENKGIDRIYLSDLISPLLGEDSENLPRFLYILRALIRCFSAVCLIVLPSHLLSCAAQFRVRRLVDTVVHLESFAGSSRETNPVFSDYHGIFHVLKTVRQASDVSDLAFKARRKKFVVEKLHLPPELEVTQQREQDDQVHAACTAANLQF